MRYGPAVIDHFLNPRNLGELQDADGVGEVCAGECGDVVRISLRVRDGRVEAARFKALGCTVAIASASLATELVTGLTLEEALEVTADRIVQALGDVPPGKVECSVLAGRGIRLAVEDYCRRQAPTPPCPKSSGVPPSKEPDTMRGTA